MKRLITIIVFLFSIFHINTSSAQTADVQDSTALVDFYNSTNGSNWTNHSGWLIGKVSTWNGVYLNSSGKVYYLNLPNNNVVGNIPNSLGNLTDLQNLILNNNMLTGIIPTSISNLTQLQYLWMQFNQLTGSIPSSIGSMVKLQNVGLQGNKLSGSIPPSIGNLSNLKSLMLASNQLSGIIPSSIGGLNNLNLLNLGSNQLSGSMPSTISDLTNLQTLNLSFNLLTGTIPSNIGNLINLTVIALGSNQLVGTIPSSIGSLSNLQNLNLVANQLTGQIPSTIGNLTKLTSCFLNNNQLSSTIPSNIGNLISLNSISLSNNQLSGNIPSLTNLTALTYLSLENNKFTFNGLESVIQQFSFTKYSPQANIEILRKDNYIFVSAGGMINNNTYEWYSDDGGLLSTITGDSTFMPTKVGKYYVHVTNSIASKLTLVSNNFEFTNQSFDFYHFHGSDISNRDLFGSTNIKVAADSSSETLIKINIINAQQCILRVQEDPNSTNKKDYGYFLPYKFYADSILYVYHHPSNANLGYQYSRTIHFEVYNSTEGKVKLTTTLDVVRPPLLLVHGVFTDESAFKNMRKKLIDDGLYRNGQVTAIVYSSDVDFIRATNEVRIKKDIALKQALFSERILCSKLDVAGHSMGGLILRNYLHSDKYNNDINKYVSFNTPHSGSQIANWALDNGFIKAVIRLLGFNPDGGALGNMKVNSPAISDLNSPGENKVPSHVIVTTQAPSSAFFSNVPNANLIMWSVALLGIKAYSYNYWEGLFDNKPTDVVVEERSQRAGLLPPYYSSTITNQWHGSTSGPNIDLYNEFIRLLNADPNDINVFTREGFNPPVLPVPYGLNRPFRGDPQSAALHITSPTLGSEFQTNSTVNVNFDYTSIDSLVLIIGSLTNPLNVYQINSPSTSISIPIPKEYFGNTQILILGFNQDGYAAMDSVNINISTSLALDSIFTNEENITVIRTHNALISISGLFEDSVIRNLTGLNGLTYSFKTNKASFQSPNKILGLANGFDTLTVSYSGKSASIPIQILDSSEWINSDDFILPVQLIEFRASLNSHQIFLNWVSENELNSRYFEIERSTDGNKFNKIGTVNAAGNSAIENKYQYIDNSLPGSLVIFYRLKIVDVDGKFVYSNIVAIKTDNSKNSFKIFPNPANEILYIQINGDYDLATLQVFDAGGRKLKEEKVLLNSNTSYSLNIKDLPKGVYNLFLKSKTINEHQKFVKQ